MASLTKEKGPWPLTILVGEAVRIPDWYGFCWNVDFGRYGVFAPIPLNLVYQLLNKMTFYFKIGFKEGLQQRIDEAYRKGRADAYKNAYENTYDARQLRKAYHQGREHLQAWYLIELEIEAKERQKEYERTS
jgi:hypothetical protein